MESSSTSTTPDRFVGRSAANHAAVRNVRELQAQKGVCLGVRGADYGRDSAVEVGMEDCF